MFKVILIDTSEIASFTGNISVFNGKLVAHTHVSVADKDGLGPGGHLLGLHVGPTLEVFVTVEPKALYIKLDKKCNAGIMDHTSDHQNLQKSFMKVPTKIFFSAP